MTHTGFLNTYPEQTGLVVFLTEFNTFFLFMIWNIAISTGV